jgi:hypothetical protein
MLKNPAPFAAPRSEFDAFLFAPIGEGSNGTPLSVLSAMSQLGVDPWEEAAELARLPGKIAIQRLASSIAALPDGAPPHPDPLALAARLIGLLPRRVKTNISRRKITLGADAGGKSGVIFYAILAAFVIVALCIFATRGSRGHYDDADAPTSGATLQQTSPSSAGQ